MDPICGVAQPSGACKVRLKIKSGLRGGTPVILCDTLTEEALQDALDSSETLRKYLAAYASEMKLGPKPPYTLKAELQYLGSDGGAIDQPTEVEVTYYGAGKGKKKGGKSLMLRLLREQEKTRRVELKQRGLLEVEREKTRQAELQQLGDLCKAVVGQAPNESLIGELKAVRAAETDRADKATTDVMKQLKAGAQKPQKDLMDLAVQGTQLWPVAKDFFVTLLGAGSGGKGPPN